MQTNIIAPNIKYFLIVLSINGSTNTSITNSNIGSNISFPIVSLIVLSCVAKEKLFELSPKIQFIAALEQPAPRVRFGKLIDKVEKYDNKRSFISGISVGIIIFGIFIGYTVTLIYARKLIMDNLEAQNIISDGEYSDLEEESISIGEIQKVLFNIIGAIVAIGQMAPNIQIIKAACSASSDYFTLYEREPKIYYSEKNLKPDRNSIKGHIEFKNIKFIYPSDKAQKPILNGLNLEIEAGKKVAFVGESGCGKSTTVNLLERLYDPVEGQILIDGIDIREFNLEYLRN